MISLLLLALASPLAPANPRTLVHPNCPRLLMELVGDAEASWVPWMPMPRVTRDELSLIRSIGPEARWIEEFMAEKFPGVPRQEPNRWAIYFEYLWQRIPEVTFLPPVFSSPPASAEIEAEWGRVRTAFENAPRVEARDGTRMASPPDSVRIKYNPRIRARIGALGFELRHQIESTPFEGKPILKLLTTFVDGPKRWRPDDAGARAFAQLWHRAFGVVQPAEFKVVRPGDANVIYQRRIVPEASARLVEEFRLFKMVYNRNRPRTALPERAPK